MEALTRAAEQSDSSPFSFLRESHPSGDGTVQKNVGKGRLVSGVFSISSIAATPQGHDPGISAQSPGTIPTGSQPANDDRGANDRSADHPVLESPVASNKTAGSQTTEELGTQPIETARHDHRDSNWYADQDINANQPAAAETHDHRTDSDPNGDAQLGSGLLSAKTFPEIPFIGDDANPWLEELLQQLLAKDFSLAPVVCYGASGTGKTLLARSLVQNLAANHGWTPNDWLITTAIDFARQVGQALETNSLGLFRTRFDAYQMMIVDDCQELSGKSQAQRELRLLIERFADSGRLLLITAPLLPTRIEGLSAGLASRMSEGICIPIHPPGEDARQVIFQMLFEQQHVTLTPDALQWITNQVNGPVPELIRNVNRICFEIRDQISDRLTSIDARPDRLVLLNRDELQTMLQGHPASRPSTRTIANQVAKAFHLKLKDLISQSRRQSIVRARGIAMFFSRRITEESLEKIGDFFGGRDHTTVLHSCRKIEKDLQNDEETVCVMQELAETLQVPWSLIETPLEPVDASASASSPSNSSPRNSR